MRNTVAQQDLPISKLSIALCDWVLMQARSSTMCMGEPVMVVSHKAELQELWESGSYWCLGTIL
jgi:hypothetical protein